MKEEVWKYGFFVLLAIMGVSLFTSFLLFSRIEPDIVWSVDIIQTEDGYTANGTHWRSYYLRWCGDTTDMYVGDSFYGTVTGSYEFSVIVYAGQTKTVRWNQGALVLFCL